MPNKSIPPWVLTMLRDISMLVVPILLVVVLFLGKESYQTITDSISSNRTAIDQLPKDIENQFVEEFTRIDDLINLNKGALQEVMIFNARQEEININFLAQITRNTEDIDEIDERLDALARFGTLSGNIPYATIPAQ